MHWLKKASDIAAANGFILNHLLQGYDPDTITSAQIVSKDKGNVIFQHKYIKARRKLMKYMREELDMTFGQIARLTNRTPDYIRTLIRQGYKSRRTKP